MSGEEEVLDELEKVLVDKLIVLSLEIPLEVVEHVGVEEVEDERFSLTDTHLEKDLQLGLCFRDTVLVLVDGVVDSSDDYMNWELKTRKDLHKFEKLIFDLSLLAQLFLLEPDQHESFD